MDQFIPGFLGLKLNNNIGGHNVSWHAVCEIQRVVDTWIMGMNWRQTQLLNGFRPIHLLAGSTSRGDCFFCQCWSTKAKPAPLVYFLQNIFRQKMKLIFHPSNLTISKIFILKVKAASKIFRKNLVTNSIQILPLKCTVIHQSYTHKSTGDLMRSGVFENHW